MSGTTSQQQLTRLYDTVFDRAPDSAGLAFWTNALNRGVTLDTVADVFVASAEFQSLGNLTTTDFVNLLYRNGLEREAEPAGRDFWTGGLQRNATDRGDVAVDISESTEGVASPLTRGTTQQGTGTAGTGATVTTQQGGTAGTGATVATQQGGTAGTGTAASDTGQQGTDATDTSAAGTDAAGTDAGTAGTDATDTSATGTDTDAAGTGTAASGSDTGTAGTGGAAGTGTGQQGVDTPVSSQQNTDQQVTVGANTTGAGQQGSGQQAVGAQGSSQQGTTPTDSGTSSAGGASDASTFVETFRTPDGDFQTVTVIGDRIPVGSEVVNIRPATADDTSDAVAFFDAPAAVREATLTPEWFL